ncbi:MAG TPA: Rrf2 family transcriptional regulator [Firmicutes bacterium]|nr:Rrf2 family transcriptional regulator [Candidatus Fermentithermobacillaceae bacterium]
MRLSTKGRYGMRAMLALARRYGEGPVPLKEIAEGEGLSEAYLEQLMSELRKAGLVRSVRGAQGGYLLGREPAAITAGDIIRVLEGPIGPVQCVIEIPGGEVCHRAEYCVERILWERLRDSIAQVLDGSTLADLLVEEKKIALASGGWERSCQPS